MKRWLFIFFLMVTGFWGYGQERIEWTEDYRIDSSDFVGEIPFMEEDNMQRYYLASHLGFNYRMNNFQFAFTKNFNKYVEVYFVPSSSWIEGGPQTKFLTEIANLNFDLAELYARKFRKRIYEDKNIASSNTLFQQTFQEINDAYAKRMAQISSEVYSSEAPSEVLTDYQQKVNFEILNLKDFCKDCKPPKNK